MNDEIDKLKSRIQDERTRRDAMSQANCDKCGHYSEITHIVESDVIHLRVCKKCGEEAERVARLPGELGPITVKEI
jgi:transcription elongation factor Elf1